MDQESNKRADKEVWYDMDRGKRYVLSGGKGVQCDELGQPARQFTQYCSGYFDYRRRAEKASHEASTYLVPKKPYSLAQLRESLQPSSLSKLDGYAQFPRPLGTSLSTTGSRTRLELAKKLKLHVQTQTSLRMPLRGSCPSMSFKPTSNPQLTCTFFASKQPTETLVKSARGALHSSAQSIAAIESFLLSGPQQKVATDSVSSLLKRELLQGSSLKSNYVSSLRTTLKPLQNLQRLSDATCNLLAKEAEIAEPPNNRDTALSYQQVRSELRREEAELEGYQQPPDKPQRVNVKGVYQMVIPSPADLFSRALFFRQQTNPAAQAQTLKRDALDRALLEKRRQQRVLKTRAMEAAIKAQEKALAEEIWECT